jgi:hypothetical protein
MIELMSNRPKLGGEKVIYVKFNFFKSYLYFSTKGVDCFTPTTFIATSNSTLELQRDSLESNQVSCSPYFLLCNYV